MDMSGMDMSGGMDMASEGLFTGVNKSIAHAFWYGIAAITALLFLSRTASLVLRWHGSARAIPSRPSRWYEQILATATSVIREVGYPQPVYFTGRLSKYFTPLPVGRWLILLVYWVVILAFLFSGTILKPNDPMYAYKYEKLGFRGAWVSITQLPFIYLLSCKFSPLTILTGVSYERLNWLHRWAARTVFLTIIVHWASFFREWWLADFVQLEIQMMPMVKYGFGAFASLGWMILSGFGFFRAMNYEVFVAQHIVAAGVLLWLVFAHVPGYARYNVYMSIGFVVFDWGARVLWGLLRNFHVLGKGTRRSSLGYSVRLEALAGDVVKVTVPEVDFSWEPGQHIFLWMWMRPFELHPFTIANTCGTTPEARPRALTLLVKARSGFTKSLHKKAVLSDQTGKSYRALLCGPFGRPPNLRCYDTVVLIACSTGASFILPLLEDLVTNTSAVRRVSVHWIIRDEKHLAWFGDTLRSLADASRRKDISVKIVVHVTQVRDTAASKRKWEDGDSAPAPDSVSDESTESMIAGSSSWREDEKTPLSQQLAQGADHGSSLSVLYQSRPTVDSMIRAPVEAACGETAIVVCGGTSITAQARTFVAALSDERAVHKGTGAQGIFLFTETYGW